MQEGLKKMDDHTMPTSAMPSFPVPCSTSTNADGDKSFFDDPSKNIKAGIVVGILLVLVVVLVALILHMIFGRLPPDAKTRDLSSAEMISCFLFPGICLLAGLLWMIQGFHKGKAATLYSGGMMILRMIIAAILIASKC
jgi:hypothetical protein